MRAYRKEKVASVVHHIVSEAIVHRLHDPRVSSLTTVTRVEMTSDLQIAKVYLSVHSGGAEERRMLEAVQHAAGFIQRMVAEGLPLRQCPMLRFEVDERAKGARRTMELLAENLRNDPGLAEAENDTEKEQADEEVKNEDLQS